MALARPDASTTVTLTFCPSLRHCASAPAAASSAASAEIEGSFTTACDRPATGVIAAEARSVMTIGRMVFSLRGMTGKSAGMGGPLGRLAVDDAEQGLEGHGLGRDVL